MKTGHRHIRIQGTTHAEVSRISEELGISMTAVVQMAVESLLRHGVKLGNKPSTRSKKRNTRTAMRLAVAK